MNGMPRTGSEYRRIYQAGYLLLLAHGFSEREAQMLASLRLAYIYYPEAFM
jgi:hypothetical protein